MWPCVTLWISHFTFKSPFSCLKHGMMVVFFSQGVVRMSWDYAQCLTQCEGSVYFKKEFCAHLGTGRKGRVKEEDGVGGRWLPFLGGSSSAGVTVTPFLCQGRTGLAALCMSKGSERSRAAALTPWQGHQPHRPVSATTSSYPSIYPYAHICICSLIVETLKIETF